MSEEDKKDEKPDKAEENKEEKEKLDKTISGVKSHMDDVLLLLNYVASQCGFTKEEVEKARLHSENIIDSLAKETGNAIGIMFVAMAFGYMGTAKVILNIMQEESSKMSNTESGPETLESLAIKMFEDIKFYAGKIN